MLGAQLLTQALKKAGVTTVFSLSGNQIMPVYDACIDAGIRIIHTRHEGAAVYMADAWAQLTGEIGVALIAGGPGFANGMSALFSAKHAESPVLLLSGDSPLKQDGLGAFQELDQLTMTRPLVKQGLRPSTVMEIAEFTAQLIQLAHSGRAGPVHLALPFDLLETQSGHTELPALPSFERDLTRPDVSELVTLLQQAKRPVIVTGPQCNGSRAAATLAALRQATGLPVIPMESPRGFKDPSLGQVKQVIQEADVVVLVGKKIDFTLDFGRSSSFASDVTLAVVDPEEAVLTLAKQQFADRLRYTQQAHAQDTLTALSTSLTPQAHQQAWAELVAQRLVERPEQSNTATNDGMLSPLEVCADIQALLDRDPNAILISDGGEFGQWIQAFCQAPKRVINGVSGAIGGGLSYAIAAKIAYPNSTVIAAMGDGTVGFHLSEFDTATRENAAFIAVIGNDHRWNAEHLIQLRNYGPERLIGCELNPDAKYEGAAQALGGLGFNVTTKQELSKALASAVNHTQAACINVHIKGAPAPEYLT